MAATGTPVVLLLSTGRALALQGPALQSTAILVTWFLGSQAGNAIADIVVGVQAPSGGLPVSFPHAACQVPYTCAHPPSGRPNLDPHGLQRYTTHDRDVPNTALFPFGHGLTYGRIAYTDLQLSAPQMTATGSLQITASISTHGSGDADEVVQLYLRDRTASVARPVRKLKDFRKVRVPAGGSVSVQFELRRAHLVFVGQAMTPIVESGLFDVWLAPSAETDGVHAQFELLS
ncbi:fibronectin type III-like domain-contianing protein [Xanthomonas arboricola]|uniref:fibronectin type III-like domain-contianing protein n=1 Tax=Xanthomonas arboricola TaxID=56448 RepID=UPI001EE80270|nr:fibronectin type III-like domain-contianing protein [Xanthomonas arboricola]